MNATTPVPDEPMAHDRMVVVDAATLARIADNGWDRDVTERCIVLSNHPERLRRGIAAVQAFRQDLRNPSLLTGRETITFLVAAVGLLLLIFRGDALLGRADGVHGLLRGAYRLDEADHDDAPSSFTRRVGVRAV